MGQHTYSSRCFSAARLFARIAALTVMGRPLGIRCPIRSGVALYAHVNPGSASSRAMRIVVSILLIDSILTHPFILYKLKKNPRVYMVASRGSSSIVDVYGCALSPGMLRSADSTAEQPVVLGALVTGVSASHFAQVRGLVFTAQRHLPQGWPIVLYDLVADLTAAASVEMQSWCGVEVRRFHHERFGIVLDPNLLTVSMWKPFIIRQCLLSLPPSGILIYADTSTRFQEPLSSPLLEAVRTVGFVSRPTDGPVAMYTHAGTALELTRLGAAKTADINEYMQVPMACGCLSLWSRQVLDRVVEPWAACAMLRECILPTGADGLDNWAGLSKRCRPGLNGHCHRNDQSALSIILHRVFDHPHIRNRSTTAWSPGRDRHGAGQGEAPYLRNTSRGTETWRMGVARVHGTVITTERSSRHSPAPTRHANPNCTRSRAPDFLTSGIDATRSWAPCAWSNGCCERYPHGSAPASCDSTLRIGGSRSTWTGLLPRESAPPIPPPYSIDEMEAAVEQALDLHVEDFRTDATRVGQLWSRVCAVDKRAKASGKALLLSALRRMEATGKLRVQGDIIQLQ